MTMTMLVYPSFGGAQVPAGPVDEAAPSNLPDGAAASFVVLVTGSRHADESHHPLIMERLAEAVHPHQPWPTRPGVRLVLRHGAAPGVDTIAARIAESWGWLLNQHTADWAHCAEDCPPRSHRKLSLDGFMYCPLAGPRRNKVMVDMLPRPNAVVAFPDRDATPGKSGTLQCLLYAIRQGLHIASVDGLLVKGGHR